MKIPAIVFRHRSEYGRQRRRFYKHDKSVPFRICKEFTMRSSYANTITTLQVDNWIMQNNIINYNNDKNMELTYHPNPTKDDLLEYFGQRIRIRKMVPDEAGKLMGLSESDLEKINAHPFSSYAERDAFLSTATESEIKRVKRESISKTAKYRLYGNSIVVDVLENIFFKMFIDTSNPNPQKSLFDFVD